MLVRPPLLVLIVASLALACSPDDDDSRFPGHGDGADGAATGSGGGSSDGDPGDDGGDSGGGGDGTGGPAKFDVGADPDDTPDIDCECGSQLGFSYIWIANSGEGTVSKIHTQTMVEDGRYVTRPDGAGDPSRTSVSLSGKAVAVANREGGVAKIWSRPQFCDPNKNGIPGLQTSTGATDVLPWGEDDCVQWYADLEQYDTNRPIAWAPGVLNQDTCEYEGEVLWTAGCNSVTDVHANAHRIDGDTGVILDTVPITGMHCSYPGAYGGAVDPDGNFWVTGFGKDLARVDAQTLAVEKWSTPIAPYGMTVDAQGRPWISSNGDARFDPVTEPGKSTSTATPARPGSRPTPRAACGATTGTRAATPSTTTTG